MEKVTSIWILCLISAFSISSVISQSDSTVETTESETTVSPSEDTSTAAVDATNATGTADAVTSLSQVTADAGTSATVKEDESTTSGIVETAAPTDPPEKIVATSILMSPYLMVNPNASNETNSKYIGYMQDLLDELGAVGNFEFEIRIVKDGEFGKEENGKWSGMIGEVKRGEVQVAAAPLTVTMNREDAVDFTMPFQITEAKIVMKKRQEGQEPAIFSLEDLVNQDVVNIGVARNSPMKDALKMSTNDVHKKLLAKLNENPKLHQENNNNGVIKARYNDDYAFLLEGAAAKYVVTNEPCDLEALDTGFFKRRYAFAVANYSPLRDKLNYALVKLKHKGVLTELEAKWMEGDCNGGIQNATNSLSLLWLLLAISLSCRYFH